MGAGHGLWGWQWPGSYFLGRESKENLVTMWVNERGGEEIEGVRKVAILTFMGQVVGQNCRYLCQTHFPLLY